ncbi:MAG: hypothetical protein P4M10_02015 [Verrucomicrobiae bacterium]|nr:hypothetical protein [Verrucomicrobiae bacterium]
MLVSATKWWLGFFREGIAIEISLRLLGVFGEEVEEEAQRFFALPAGGFKQAAQDALILQTVKGSVPTNGT